MVVKIAARPMLRQGRITIATLTAGKSVVAAEFSFALGALITRRPRSERAISSRTVVVFLETLTSGLVGPLGAAISRPVRFPLAELFVGGSCGRTRIASILAHGVRTLVRTILSRTKRLTIRTVGTTATRAVILVEALRTIGKRPVATTTRSIALFTSRRKAIAFAGIWFAGAGIGLLAIGSGALGLTSIDGLIGLAFAGKTAFGEFLLGSAGYPGSALAGRGPIAPAAAIIVFVFVAGHERGSLRVQLSWHQIGNEADADRWHDMTRALFASQRILTQNRHPLLLKAQLLAGFFQ